jgi:hypothetical protein
MEKSAIALAAVHIVQQVRRGEISASDANEKLLDLILKAETVSDLNFAHAAREGIERLAKIWGIPDVPEQP